MWRCTEWEELIKQLDETLDAKDSLGDDRGINVCVRGSHGWAGLCQSEPVTDTLLSLSLEEGVQGRETPRERKLRGQSCRLLRVTADRMLSDRFEWAWDISS